MREHEFQFKLLLTGRKLSLTNFINIRNSKMIIPQFGRLYYSHLREIDRMQEMDSPLELTVSCGVSSTLTNTTSASTSSGISCAL